LESKGKLAQKLFETAVDVGWLRFQCIQGRAKWHLQLLLWPLLKRIVADKIVARLGGQIRVAICGGAPLSLAVARVFLGLGVPVVQGYGMTETSPIISVNSLQDNDPESVGTPLQDVVVKIAGNGELLVQSPGVMLGYWRNDEATRKTIDADRWLHTGDKVEIRDRRIYITGRVKEIIVLANGEKIPPADMESAITLDSFFEQAIVCGEGKPFLCVLLVLNHAQWCAMKAQEKWTGDDAALLKESAVHSKILARLATCLRAFPSYAQVRRVILELDPWTIETGLVTPTLKLRRTRILEKYEANLKEQYRGH
jgi:long-chain acyl-CoA synthetase